MNKSKKPTRRAGKEREKLRSSVFLGSVVLHSALGTCDRLRTASGVVKDKRLRGVGYNGSVSGLAHCDDIGHLMVEGHCLRTRHGEKNLISNTDREHLRGAKVIVIGTPCLDCLKDLAHEGVAEVNYTGTYNNSIGKEHIEYIAKEKGMVLKYLNVDFADLFQELFNNLSRKGGILEWAGYKLEVVKKKIK
ncbi:MAG: hypothetical protein HYT62_04330 [Candidatus Yanofskybacteria bacterium]|nr:hypothetical protein [Candidatus Yanofskybacteria bacterium]